MEDFISINNFADVLGISRMNALKWGEKNSIPVIKNEFNIEGFPLHYLRGVPQIDSMIESKWDEESHVTPKRKYNSIELFAGGGGLALGMELAGFHHIMLNEFNKDACDTLRLNRPD